MRTTLFLFVLTCAVLGMVASIAGKNWPTAVWVTTTVVASCGWRKEYLRRKGYR